MRVVTFLMMSAALLMPAIAVAQPGKFTESTTLEGFFEGRTSAIGEFSAINGFKQRFDVELTGTWDGRVLNLREDFTYQDGQKDTKTWIFTKVNENQYKGTREDVIGETTVNIVGNVAKFDYLVYLDGANKKMKVHFYDTMVFENGTVVNNARVTKFGIPIAKTKVVFSR